MRRYTVRVLLQTRSAPWCFHVSAISRLLGHVFDSSSAFRIWHLLYGIHYLTFV